MTTVELKRMLCYHLSEREEMSIRSCVLLIGTLPIIVFGQSIFIAEGDAAAKSDKWHEAEIAYQKAVEADPRSSEAHRKLAGAIAMQMAKPGTATSAADLPALHRILEAQKDAAQLAPQDRQTLLGLARVEEALWHFSTDKDEQTRFREAAWADLRRVIELPNPPSNAAFRFDLAKSELYWVGSTITNARHGAPIQPNNPQIPDEELRNGLALALAPIAADSVAQLNDVLQRQPDHGFAMLLLAIAYSLRMQLDASDAVAEDRQLSNRWEAAFKKQFGANASPATEQNLVSSFMSPQVVLASGIFPPPPPPPPRMPASPGIQRIGGNVMEANLVKKVQPAYPPSAKAARVQGVVEFTAQIDKTGRVIQLDLVRGHPLLVNAARDAVMQWEYRPTLLNGQPVAVITDIIVNFILTQ
jgi:TonB family protein